MFNATDVTLLCRLCSENSDVNVPIFGEDKNILLKILACLPVKVSLEDNLPKKICCTCLDKLESHHQFRQKAEDTERQLLNWLNQPEQLIADPSSSVEQSECKTVIIKEEVVISGNVDEINSNGQDSIENNNIEKKNNKQTEDEESQDFYEPLPKRRKTSETLQEESKDQEINFMLKSVMDIDPQTKIEDSEDDDLTVDESQALHLELEIESETSDAVLSSDNVPCQIEDCEVDNLTTDKPDILNIETIDVKNDGLHPSTSDDNVPCTDIEQNGDESSEIDLKLNDVMKIKNCVVVLGDLENVNPNKYQFVRQSLSELKSNLAFNLKCYSCGINFDNAVSFITHIIAEHTEKANQGRRTSTEITSVSCKFCSSIFEDEEELETHAVTVHPYQCLRCNRAFMNVHQSLLHTKMHFIMDKRKPDDKKTLKKSHLPDKEIKNEYVEQKVKKMVKQTNSSTSKQKNIQCDQVKKNEEQKSSHSKKYSTLKQMKVQRDQVKDNEQQKSSQCLTSKQKKIQCGQIKEHEQQKSSQCSTSKQKKIQCNQVKENEQQKSSESSTSMQKKILENEQQNSSQCSTSKQKKIQCDQVKDNEQQKSSQSLTTNQKKIQCDQVKENKQQKSYHCIKCNSQFEDCYQLQRHCVAKHKKMPEKRYGSIKLYKCVLCAKHYPSINMLEEHKATHVIDVRTTVDESESKPKRTTGEKSEPKPKRTTGEKSEPKPKKKQLPVVPTLKTNGSPILLNSDSVIEIDDDNKSPSLDESPDILDNIEIICNDIEFDTEDSSTKNEENQTQNLSSGVVEILPSVPLQNVSTVETIQAHQPFQPSISTIEVPYQTQNVLPQINFIHPPPLILTNFNKQALTRLVPMLPGNCSVIAMPCASNSIQNPNFTVDQNALNSSNDSQQIKFVSVDNIQPCVSLPSNLVNNKPSIMSSNNSQQIKLIPVENLQPCASPIASLPSNVVNNKSPIVLNTYLKHMIDPALKFRKIKPKSQELTTNEKNPDTSTDKTNVDEVITVIIERETNVKKHEDNTKKKNEQIKIVVRNAEKSTEAVNNREESSPTNIKDEVNSKLAETANSEKLISCIKIDSSDSEGSDNSNKEQSEDNVSLVNQTKDVIEIDSSSDESKGDVNANESNLLQALCAICNRRHSARFITMKYLIYICTWCSYTVSVVTNKIELFDKFRSPLATGILTAVSSIECSEALQCNVCKLLQGGFEFTSANSLVICNLCKLKIASVSTILLSIREKARYNNNKRIEQNKFCKIKCDACGISVKIQTVTYFNDIVQTVTYFNDIVLCNACRPKLFEIAAVASSMCGITKKNSQEQSLRNILLQTRCFVCKDMKSINNISLLNGKSTCTDCKYNVMKFAVFQSTIMQKPKRCSNCKTLKKGLPLEELSTYCSKCLKHRPNACLKCDRTGRIGKCRCKKASEEKTKSTEAEMSDDEDKLIIDLESENEKTNGKIKTQKQKEKKVQSNSSNSSSPLPNIKTTVEKNSVLQNVRQNTPSISNTQIISEGVQSSSSSCSSPTEILENAREKNSTSQKIDKDIPSTSATGIVPRIYLKPMNSLLEPKSKTEMKINCGICNEKIEDGEDLSLHLGVITCHLCKAKQNTFSCFYCSLVFSNKVDLTQHKDDVHFCRLCSKYRGNVAQHLQNVIRCQICQAIFCKKLTLGDHYRQKHNSRWCIICDIVLRDDYEVLVHRAQIHNQK